MRSTVALLLAAAAPGTVLAAQQKCAPLHFLYARATGEPPQNFGETAEAFDSAASKVWSKGYGAAGFSLYGNVTKLIPGTTGTPVHYPASFTSSNGVPSMAKGVEEMISQLDKMSKACPEQKYVLGGHSQGGAVTVGAIPKLSKDILSRVVAVTMFGSPNCPNVAGAPDFASKCRSYCNKGDAVCDPAARAAKGGTPKGGAPPAGGMAGMPGMAPKGSAPPAGGMAGMPGMGAKGGVPPTGGMAGMGSMAGMSGHGMVMAEADSAADDLCTSVDLADVKGYEAKGPENAHLIYNKDGHYVKAAACFIAKQFKGKA